MYKSTRYFMCIYKYVKICNTFPKNIYYLYLYVCIGFDFPCYSGSLNFENNSIFRFCLFLYYWNHHLMVYIGLFLSCLDYFYFHLFLFFSLFLLLFVSCYVFVVFLGGGGYFGLLFIYFSIILHSLFALYCIIIIII